MESSLLFRRVRPELHALVRHFGADLVFSTTRPTTCPECQIEFDSVRNSILVSEKFDKAFERNSEEDLLLSLGVAFLIVDRFLNKVCRMNDSIPADQMRCLIELGAHYYALSYFVTSFRSKSAPRIGKLGESDVEVLRPMFEKEKLAKTTCSRLGLSFAVFICLTLNCVTPFL
jgi:hypothetical protein